MARYVKIKNGIECQLKTKGGVIVVRKCRRLVDKEKVSTNKVLKELGIRSY